jgi:hypothetical protein
MSGCLAASAHDRYWHFRDITVRSGYVRLRGQSGRGADIVRGPILTHSGPAPMPVMIGELPLPQSFALLFGDIFAICESDGCQQTLVRRRARRR